MAQSNLLSEVPSGNYFKFSDGREAKSLEELYNIISTSPPEVFSEHVNGSKNDFADWIRNCVLHVALADKLAPVRTAEEYFRIFSGELMNLKMGSPLTVPADDGLGSIDAELNSVLDEEILAAMNDGPEDVPVPTAQPTSPPPMAKSIPLNHEESFEYEEVFKPLVEELRNEVFNWE